MKVFQGDGWGGKVNFVDENNVLVGYDIGQCCCEHADWFIEDEIYTHTDVSSCGYEKAQDILDGYNFDPTFFEETSNYREFERGGMVIFKLVNEITGGVKYLHLFNCHNGYYGHGFEMSVNNENLHYGTL